MIPYREDVSEKDAKCVAAAESWIEKRFPDIVQLNRLAKDWGVYWYINRPSATFAVGATSEAMEDVALVIGWLNKLDADGAFDDPLVLPEFWQIRAIGAIRASL